MEELEATVVISTYNRAPLLAQTLRGVLAAASAVDATEVVVVDNNSADDTRAVVESLAARDGRVRYVFERRQGVSYGRNAGIAAARGRIVLFTDDDIVVAPDWVATALTPFVDPAVSFVMGKVLPIWDSPKPPWLHTDITGPIAKCDAGNEIIRLGTDPPCLPLTANLAVRRRALEAIGGFDPQFGMRGRSGPSGMLAGEDHDLGLRLIDAGFHGLYLPALVAYNRLTVERLTKAFIRHWMFVSGRTYSLMGRRRGEAGLRHWLGVPGFMYRRGVRNAMEWMGAVVRGRRDRMFLHEARLFAVAGFFVDRWFSGG